MPIVNVPEEFLSLVSFNCHTAISLQTNTNLNLFRQYYTNAIEVTKSTSLKQLQYIPEHITIAILQPELHESIICYLPESIKTIVTTHNFDNYWQLTRLRHAKLIVFLTESIELLNRIKILEMFTFKLCIRDNLKKLATICFRNNPNIIVAFSEFNLKINYFTLFDTCLLSDHVIFYPNNQATMFYDRSSSPITEYSIAQKDIIQPPDAINNDVFKTDGNNTYK